MASSINRVELLGNLAAAPELRNTQGGKPVASMTLYTNRRWKDAGGDLKEESERHSIVVWDKLAETCASNLRKGSRLYLSGRLQTRKWQDKDGQDRYTTEIVANEVVFLDGRGGDEVVDEAD